MALMSVTRVRVRSCRDLPGFVFCALRSATAWCHRRQTSSSGSRNAGRPTGEIWEDGSGHA